VHELLALTMIDPATSWFDRAFLTPRGPPWQIAFSSVPSLSVSPRLLFLARWLLLEEFQHLLHSYGIKPKPASSRNPQANSVIERVRSTLHNLLRSFELQQTTMDPNDPWSGFLAAAAYAIRSTYHTTLQATPAEIVFGRDMLWDCSIK